MLLTGKSEALLKDIDSLTTWMAEERQKELAWSCIMEELSWILGKGSSPEGGQTLEQAPQGSGYCPKLLEFKEDLDNTLWHRIWILIVLWGASS